MNILIYGEYGPSGKALLAELLQEYYEVAATEKLLGETLHDLGKHTITTGQSPPDTFYRFHDQPDPYDPMFTWYNESVLDGGIGRR